jgi:hypothetical protein
MKHITILILLNLFATAFASGNISPESRVKIIVPSAEEETQNVWNTIRDIRFFEEHNYQLSLPEGELIKTMESKSRSGNLSDEDYQELLRFMQDEVYNPEDYQKGFNAIDNNRELINKMINEICELEKDWYFKEFGQYEIKLTLYGPGGSYNPVDGSILILATPSGGFKQYQNPANTIIHEIIHIGIEESIIQKFNVPHTLKERIIDNIVMINFKEYLPEYRIQGFGDARIDPYLKDKNDIKELDKVMDDFMKKHLIKN